MSEKTELGYAEAMALTRGAIKRQQRNQRKRERKSTAKWYRKLCQARGWRAKGLPLQTKKDPNFAWVEEPGGGQG